MTSLSIHEWALRHGVPFAAVQDLLAMMGAADAQFAPGDAIGESETAVQNSLRLEMSRKGGRLWRNNVGAGKLENGQFIRWGIANDSKQMNETIKSSDLIGIRPELITPDHVGRRMGIFVAREVKPMGWRFTGSGRENAQLAFIKLITSLGGDAKFAHVGIDV